MPVNLTCSGGAFMASFARIGEEPAVAPAQAPLQGQDWAERIEKAIERGANHLLSLQAEQGYWQGELEADSTLESDYIYYLHVLGKADRERGARLANSVRKRQLPDGGWSIYPGGPSELNATCKAYFAWKLAGDSPYAPNLVRAREMVHRLGGLEHSNSYVRFYLALVGAVSWDLVPSIPPELMLIPHWFIFNIYEMSSWTRGIVIPMAILSSLRPNWRLPEHAHVDELFTLREIKEFSRFEIEDEETIRMQPCVSPVWDTCIAMVALEEAGLPPDHPALVKAANWILSKQVLGPGDWQVKNKDAEPGGWAFEFRNDFYPDVDDTAFVLMALQRVKYPEPARMEAAMRRGIQWLLSMQNRDGGWGAFDRDNNRKFLCNIPFADHNAMIDPSTADVTARVVECLGRYGWPADHPVIQRAVRFLLQDQCKDGSWFGRWGANYIYGTSGVLRALATVSLATRELCQRAVNWLRSVQKVDGSFGESLLSYDLPAAKGQGPSTASQTAWGLIGLLASAGVEDSAVKKAVAYLVHRQEADGSWSEPEFTGTGFPGVFYLKYHLYRNSFPVYALARYFNQSRRAEEYAAVKFQPSEFRQRSGI